MLTLEQIKNVQFTKVRGGYKDEEVDDFIDQCVATVSGLIEERNASNKKMEVLADKLVEYRNDEDSIRAALVNAQRLGDTIVREANQKAALIQEDANIKAQKVLDDANKALAEAEENAKNAVVDAIQERKAEEAELERLKKEVSLFKNRIFALYREHLALIDLLPEEAPAKKAEEEPVKEEPPVQETEEFPVPAIEEPISAEEEMVPAEEPVVQFPTEEPTPAVETVPLVFKEPEEEPKSRFGDLKFGSAYDISEDSDEDEKESKSFFKRKK